MAMAMFSVKINGELCGYFPGNIRQRDPLSPCRFVIVIKVLNLILLKFSTNHGFQFHWRTKECSFINLSFADDLMIFLPQGS